jgi:formylmethanofuran dehydrogenase subunit C
MLGVTGELSSVAPALFLPDAPMPLLLTPSTSTSDGPLSIDFERVVPDRLLDLDAAAVARFTVLADGRPCPLGELFAVHGAAADARIECVGDFSRVHRLGAGMQRGEITVHGSVGRHAGEAMAGGRLVVKGDAGDWLAAGMTGGEVLVEGNAGDNPAAALPGDDLGVRGGLIVINGDVGCLAGARMRRGLLGIGGSCGEAAAFEMRAGTVIVAGRVGRRPGMGMRRGSVIALSAMPDVPPTFGRGASWSPTVLPLLAARLARAGFRATAGRPADAFGGVWQHWHGDLLTGGRGEIFHRLGG